MLGSLRASLWSILRSMLRISMSFRVRCMRPFWRPSDPFPFESSVAFESDGEDIVAATKAAIAASSLGDRFLLPDPAPSSLLSLPLPFSFPSLAAKRSFKNCGVSRFGRFGSLTSETRDETDLRPSEAVSNISETVSCAEVIQPPVVFRNSDLISQLRTEKEI